MVFGARPADLDMWQDGDGGLAFLRDASEGSQFVWQWELRITATEGTLQDAANSKLRRLLSHNRTFQSTQIKVRFPRSELGPKVPRGDSGDR